MLVSLRIQDLAIIDELDIEFSPGLNILTGETGAGKSIILGALELILGARGSPEDIRSHCDRARVEAVFDIRAVPRVRHWLQSHGIQGDDDDDLLIARELSRLGKGRHFIMGSLAPLASVRELGDLLVDIHGQHQHQSLLAVENHLDALDRFARTDAIQSQVAALWSQWQELGRCLDALSRDEREIERRKDTLAFQVREIEAAQLVAGEDVPLEQERQRLAHAEALVQTASHATDLLSEGETTETTILALLARLEDDLAEIARFDPTMAALADEVRDERFRLEDIAARLSQYRASLDADPRRLEMIDDRLDLIRRMKRKYGAEIEDILALGEENRRELDRLEHRDDELARIQSERIETARALGEACEELSRAREAASRALEEALVGVLADLNMPDARFAVAIERKPAEPDEGAPIGGRCFRVGPTGVDQVEFLISPNPGEDLKPLRKIASGGELSRIMLALKSLLAGNDQIATLVFDEIDVGIGGATAEHVGEKMAELSRSHQIVCITHLPQIAARAEAHFAVEKSIVAGRAVTNVRRLTAGERPVELARMLDGAQVTDLGRRHAAQMIKQAKAKDER
jgi:DNA repair protein RecN (Recombination protein N)